MRARVIDLARWIVDFALANCSNFLRDFRHREGTRGNSCRYQISMIPKLRHNIALGF